MNVNRQRVGAYLPEKKRKKKTSTKNPSQGRRNQQTLSKGRKKKGGRDVTDEPLLRTGELGDVEGRFRPTIGGRPTIEEKNKNEVGKE